MFTSSRPIVFALILAASMSVPALAQSVEQGKFGRGLKTGQAYAAADYNPIYDVTPITAEMWARVNGNGVASTLISNEPRNSVLHWELFSQKETGRFAAFVPGYDPSVIASTVDITDDQWHYVAFVFDGKKVQLFVDAKAAGEKVVHKVGQFPDTGPLNFGFQVGIPPHPDTTIDEVRISRVARAITALPDKPFENDADTIGLWHFDEDEKGYAKGGFSDLSTNRNPARLKDAKVDGTVNNGGFDNTVGGKTRWQEMDFGPFFSSTITPPLNNTNVTHKGISIRLGKEKKYAVTFDTELLRMSAAWEGPFIKIYPGREGLGNHPEMGARPFFHTAVRPGWIVGKLDAQQLKDTRVKKMGSLPVDKGHYSGLYTSGDRVVLAYTVNGAKILETVEAASADADFGMSRTFQVGASDEPLSVYVAEIAGNEKVGVFMADTGIGAFPLGHADLAGVTTAIAIMSDTPHIETSAFNGHHYLTIPPHAKSVSLRLTVVKFDGAKLENLAKLTQGTIDDLTPLTRGGPAQYPPITTKCALGKSDGPYAVDTLTAPDDNPWHSFLRFGGVDFFKNGDAAVCSVSGDVWVVSGIDDKLQNLKWKRFATGLFQPLGLKVVNDEVYVLGRDQITRLHDLNGDGEADFYENFNNDGLVTTNGHAYVTCLETDAAGNFYYIKCGDNTPQGGTVVRVSPDGKKLDFFAPGIRNGNGLGMSPSGQLTEADNEGDWVPASRIDYVKQGQFLGYTPMAHTAETPKSPGRPILWMPQNLDNSSGGQVWVEGDKWGLPAGTMLHTSYGMASLLEIMPETVKTPDGSEAVQAGGWKFPLTFGTGIMRGRFRAADGQLYVCGLRGWQTTGIKDGALQRVRYTGKPLNMPAEMHVHENGVLIRFTNELDRESAADAGSWSALQWNYHWNSDYGSKQWSVLNPSKQGYDTLEVKKATLLPDGKSVFLEIAGLQPVMQMRISCNIEAKDGTAIKTDVYNTIHGLGAVFTGK